MSTLKLRFLGPPSIEIDDEPVTFSRRKSLALLAYLGVTGVAQPPTASPARRPTASSGVRTMHVEGKENA